jgi:hypothetical protein
MKVREFLLILMGGYTWQLMDDLFPSFAVRSIGWAIFTIALYLWLPEKWDKPIT